MDPSDADESKIVRTEFISILHMLLSLYNKFYPIKQSVSCIHCLMKCSVIDALGTDSCSLFNIVNSKGGLQYRIAMRT